MKKRITAFFLCLMMLVSMIPVVGITVTADAATDQPIKNDFPTEKYDEETNPNGYMEIWTGSELNSATKTGSYKLMANIDGVAYTVLADNGRLNIDLNGFTLTAAPTLSNNRLFRVNLGQVLSIFDTSVAGTGKIVPSEGATYAFVNMNDGVFNMYGGTVDGWNTSGAGVIQYTTSNAIANLCGGKIINCGGEALIRIKDGATVNIYDSFTFENNTATLFADYGANAKFNICGGVFNDAVTVSFANSPTVNVTGGSFKYDPTSVLGGIFEKSGDYYIPVVGGSIESGWTELNNGNFSSKITSEGKYILTEDISVGSTIAIQGIAVSLDLNGHTITALSTVSQMLFKLLGNATFNIYDYSVKKTGAIVAGANCKSSCIQGNAITLNIHGGSISNWNTNDGNYKGVLQFANDCEVNLIGGKITNCNAVDGIIRVKGDGLKVNIKDLFTFEENTSYTFFDYGTKPTINISGGIFNHEITASFANGVINITGGTFSKSPDSSYISNGYESVEMKGLFGKASVYKVHSNDGVVADSNIKLSGMALKLYDDISVGFRVSNGIANPTLKLELNGVIETLTEYTTDDSGNYIFVTKRISPQFAGDAMYVTVLSGSSVGQSYYTSIKDYCDKALAVSNNTLEINLIKSTLNYCAAAQKYLNYKTDSLVYEGSVSEPTINDTDVTHNGNEILAISVGLSNGIRIKVHKNSLRELVVKDSAGNELERISGTEFEKTEGGYYVYFKASSAAQFRKLYTFEIHHETNGVTESLKNYSFEAYAYNTVNNQNCSDKLTELVKAMMIYGDSAYAYAVSLTQ